MNSIIIRYEDNGLVCYNGKDYVESLTRVQREKSAIGALQIGKNVMVKTKSRVCKVIAQSVAYNTSIRPFSFANTENCSYTYRRPPSQVHELMQRARHH